MLVLAALGHRPTREHVNNPQHDPCHCQHSKVSHEWEDCVFLTTTPPGFINSQEVMPKSTGGCHIWVAGNSFSSHLIREEEAVDVKWHRRVLCYESPVLHHLTQEPNVPSHTAAAKTYCKLEQHIYFDSLGKIYLFFFPLFLKSRMVA